jgi:two-component system CitB family response regulator
MPETQPEIGVIVVDDDFRIAGLHGGIVEATPGFALLGTAGTVRATLRLIETARPALVLLDAYLPDGSGLDLVRRIDPDVIMVTAANDPVLVRKALRHGAFSFLVKPFDPAALRARLDAYSTYRSLLGSGGALEQSALDAALAARHPVESNTTRPRTATEQAVLDSLLAAAGPRSAPEVAESLGVSRATAQRHLGALAAEGLVTLELKYGSTGRPEHRYSRAR